MDHAPEERLEHHSYARDERPDVEVQVAGEWLPGEAVARWRDATGQLWYWVNYRRAGVHTRRPADFRAEDVRLDPADHAGERKVSSPD